MSFPSNCKILIVDDFFTIRKMMRTNLKQITHIGEVLEAENINDAFNILETEYTNQAPIQLILSDWEMPGGTGLDFLNKVRSDERFKNLPFLLVTTVNEKDNVLTAIKSGASNYLVKPWTNDELQKKIQAAWDKHQ